MSAADNLNFASSIYSFVGFMCNEVLKAGVVAVKRQTPSSLIEETAQQLEEVEKAVAALDEETRKLIDKEMPGYLLMLERNLVSTHRHINEFHENAPNMSLIKANSPVGSKADKIRECLRDLEAMHKSFLSTSKKVLRPLVAEPMEEEIVWSIPAGLSPQLHKAFEDVLRLRTHLAQAGTHADEERNHYVDNNHGPTLLPSFYPRGIMPLDTAAILNAASPAQTHLHAYPPAARSTALPPPPPRRGARLPTGTLLEEPGSAMFSPYTDEPDEITENDPRRPSL
ncbi:hypothetical protein NLI96_g10455 [Meripilus lineatus]|uniref:Uncharacterized protein n=1 Tax=Meripilus lineatus TaxID=2056292 RepID=A0AAD5YA40_9APHY|nr:hypothetical protein NLI96_g10455 [Physisporinus lineatus]